MKKLNKLANILLAIVMVFTMATSVFAEAPKTTININGTGEEYAAFRLLDATDGNSGKFAYTVNEKYREVLSAVTGKTVDVEIINYINSLGTPDYETDGVTIKKAASEKIREFANAMYRKIIEVSLTADETTTTKSFANVPQGYYLIAETKIDGGVQGDSHSLVMLDTAGNETITITSKEDIPTLVKEVKETNDTTGVVTDWQEAGSYDIGDKVPFRLTGTLPNDYGDYTTYVYKFHDKMDAGFTFMLDDPSISTDDDISDKVVVKIDDKIVASTYYTINTGCGDGCTFEVVFADLKTVKAGTDTEPSATASSKITVEYTATLNESAKIGATGNKNYASLEYSNNPYGEGTGETVEDQVIVFTFDLVVNKTDGTNPLNGAGFTLKKYKADEGKYVIVKTIESGDTKYCPDGHKFTFEGLDCGRYELEESTVPAGYNKIPTIVFTIEPTYTPGVNLDNNSPDVPTLSNLVVKNAANEVISGKVGDGMTFTVDLTEGTLTTTIVNNSGTELPSTGGIGTTIFTVAGVTLMALATVMFVTKRKVSEEE